MVYDLDNIIGSVFETKKYGLVTVLEVVGKVLKSDSRCKIRFLKTNSERYISYANLRLGNVKDYEAKIVCGVACKGNINVPNGSYTRKIYELWKVLIGRCYNENFNSYKNYGAKGVTVCEEWLNFSNFYKEHTEIDGYDFKEFNKGNLVLDKDIKQLNLERNNRIYSKETCKWVTQQENNQFQSRKSIKYKYFIAISPNGVKYDNLISQMDFAKEHGLNNKNISRCIQEGTKHNGWSFYPIV